MVRVYKLHADLAQKAQGANEQTMLDALLAEMENASRIAHDKNGFTPSPLKELAELQ